MKPAPFTYHAPRSRAEVFALLAGAENARLLAGGQSLVPMMNFRLAAPDVLIDLNNVDDLAGIAVDGGVLKIGAMTRQRAAEQSPIVARVCPLLVEALERVGTQQIRNRGTVGGSIAHLDPTAELLPAAVALGASVTLSSATGERRLTLPEFAEGYLTTAIEPDEILTEIEFPLWPEGHGWAFDEVTRRGDSYAVVSAAALVDLDAAGRIRTASLAIGGLGHVAVAVPEVVALEGASLSDAAVSTIAAAARNLDADGEGGVSADYKRHLAGVLAARVIRKAVARAGGAAHV